MLNQNSIEIITPGIPQGTIKFALFDFDGTISLIREGWQQIMIPMMVEILLSTPRHENREEIEQTVAAFNAANLDGILIVLLAYSQGAWILRALQDNRLPIALAIVQPDQVVGSDWEELDLTVNQGIHGAQDNANVIVRMGIPCQFFAGNRH